MRPLTLCLCALAFAASISAQPIELVTRDAVVWSVEQVVRGVAPRVPAASGVLELNGTAIPFLFSAQADTFAVPVRLTEGVNTAVVHMDSSGVTLSSDTLRLTLGYRLRPDIHPWAEVRGRAVTLHATLLGNPDSAALSFLWENHPLNPAVLPLSAPADSVCDLTIPPGAPPGEYRFRVTVPAEDDTVRATAMVTVDSSAVVPFDAARDRTRWIDSAIVYGVTPYIFVMEGKFQHITARIPELADLGVTALWIQPVYATHYGGQGYDVIDYFRVRQDLGTENDLRDLISTAHAHGLRVLLDFVPNHTSIQHSYARDATARGELSHYYSFYQREVENAPYSQHYHFYQGFINYFWNDLPNLNYDHPEVRRMMTEAGKYWVEKFDIDGYRIDAVWGVNARRPEFMQEWRLALKRIKPDLLLLGEDKASWPSVFDRRFDAAYDWAPEESWVSHWTWQTTYSTTSNPTIFNYASSGQRSALLRASLTNSGNGFPQGAKVFRFMENNDTFRFLPTHDLARTKMVAALLFSLPGIPLIFNGQEIGAQEHPYSTLTILKSAGPIADQDPYGLFPVYRRLAQIRKRNPALLGNRWSELPVTPGSAVYAFRRWDAGQEILVVVNMASSPIYARVTLPVDSMNLARARDQFFTDLLTGDVVSVPHSGLDSVVFTMPAYTTRILLADTAAVTGIDRLLPSTVPVELALLQNYPNPFNPATTVAFDLPSRQEVRLAVHDILGRRVAVLANGIREAGRHTVRWDARDAATGVYFCRLEAGGVMLLRKMLLVR